MSKNSIIPFLKDYLINFLTRPFLLDTNDVILLIAGYRHNYGIIIKHMLYVGITLPYICLKNRK